MRYVIIGGSIAGISAAKAIRENDTAAVITVISNEKSKSYYRPMIPLVIEGQKSEADITFPDDPLAKYNVKTIFGTATGVKTQSREVLLASEKRIAYDKLLIATGGIPTVPAIRGAIGEGVFTLRTMDDAIRIRDAAARVRSAAVIGGGLVGIKAAAALSLRRAERGREPMDVTVVEMLPQILGQRLDKRGAEIIRSALVDDDITIATNETVVEIVREKEKPSAVKLASGKTVKADMIIIAAGVRPSISYLKDSGIQTSAGVLVNEFLQTNISDVYAAGDVVEGKELLSGKTVVSGLWTNAVEMGRFAGINMTGRNVKYPGFLSVMNATEIAGIPFISVGLIEPEGGEYITVMHDRADGYSKLVFKDEFLVGVVFVRDVKNAGIYTNLIKNRIPIARLKDKVARRAAQYSDFLTL
jgi:NAD(P)H-nitrite reductase large subunit